MNWLQKIAVEDEDDSFWDYEKYREFARQGHPQVPDYHQTYQSVGHTSPNTALYYIDSDFRYHEMSPKEVLKHPPEKRTHNLFAPEGDNILDDETTPAWGRIDLDTNEASLSISRFHNLTARQIKKILDVAYGHLYKYKTYVWFGQDRKVSFQDFYRKYM